MIKRISATLHLSQNHLVLRGYLPYRFGSIEAPRIVSGVAVVLGLTRRIANPVFLGSVMGKMKSYVVKDKCRRPGKARPV